MYSIYVNVLIITKVKYVKSLIICTLNILKFSNSNFFKLSWTRLITYKNKNRTLTLEAYPHLKGVV